MLDLYLPPEIEQRLDAAAKKTGRSKSHFAREAILRQIEDIEDEYVARRRFSRGGPRATLEGRERNLKNRTKRPRAPHCERSEAFQAVMPFRIASSLHSSQ